MNYLYTDHVYRRKLQGLAALLALAGLLTVQAHGDALLVLYPAAWEVSVTNYLAFKSRLGYDVYSYSLEDATGGSTDSYEVVRSFLTNFRTNTVAPGEDGYVLLLGTWSAIPAPMFRVTPSDDTYYSDLYYRNLYTDFDSDGDGFFAEFGPGTTNDFNATTLDATFPTITNDLHVGRIPFLEDWSAASVEEVLNRIMAFERETGTRKDQAIMSAGRIDTSLFAADSWSYALKGICSAITNGYPEKQLVTVVHVASNFTDAGIDYYVEGADLTADYTEGQDIIRGLWETNDACSFLCNVSHGGSYYDFALRRNGAGFPSNVHSAVILSMSCSSYRLGKAAVTSGVASAYLGSTAVVTPDVTTILFGGKMVSAQVQESASLKIFGAAYPLGKAFGEEFNYYTSHIMTDGYWAYSGNRTGMLRNIVGFQLIGDPTMRHVHPDSDSDGLLDPEEITLGTQTNVPDSDGDGLPDGYEVYTSHTEPLINDGNDCDSDNVSNAGELVAGTDPFSAVDYPCVLTASNLATVISVQVQTSTGRTYCLQHTPTLSAAAWSNVSTAIDGTGNRITMESPPMENTASGYRVLITRP